MGECLKRSSHLEKRVASVWYTVDLTLEIPLYLYHAYFKIFVLSTVTEQFFSTYRLIHRALIV